MSLTQRQIRDVVRTFVAAGPHAEGDITRRFAVSTLVNELLGPKAAAAVWRGAAGLEKKSPPRKRAKR